MKEIAKSNYDAVIIGGGHNGLTNAAVLAKKEYNVLVLERRKLLGGVAAGEEFHPGYRTNGLLHDVSRTRPQVVTELKLDRHGLKLRSRRPAVLAIGEGGERLFLNGDVKGAAREIAALSPGDAARYAQYRRFMDKIRRPLWRLLDSAPPQIDRIGGIQAWNLTKIGISALGLGARGLVELLRAAPMSVADWLGEWFEADLLKATLAGAALHGTFAGPRTPGSNANLLLWESGSWCSIAGGPQALVDALERAARYYGVEIHTECDVRRLLVSGGAVRGVVLADGREIRAPLVAASCDPRHTLLDLIPRGRLEQQVEHHAENIRGDGIVGKVHLALDAPLALVAPSGARVEFARVVGGLNRMEKAFDAVKYQRYAESPVLDIHVPTVTSPELAPPGHSVVSVLVDAAPYRLAGPWDDEQRERFGDTVVSALEQAIPGASKAIVAREVLSPVDLEARYGLVRGHLYHGDHSLDQLMMRPTPECAHYRTPIAGLYLCGSGSHPGGGITCGPGLQAAAAILSDRAEAFGK